MFKDVARKHTAEKTLWAYVVRRAVFDYVLYRGQGSHRMEWQTSAHYLFGEEFPEMDDVGEDFGITDLGGDCLTLEQTCGLFGWDPDRIRRLAKTMTRPDIKKFESDQLRDILDSERFELVTLTPRWDGYAAYAPPLTPLNYTGAALEQIKLIRVDMRAEHHSHVSLDCMFPPAA